MAPDTHQDSALITTFAHDLRVPLRSIVMTAQRIQRRTEELSDETKARLEEILAAAKRQEELIAAVVEYEQASQPGLAGESPLALRLAIQTACMKVDAYRQAKGGAVSFDADQIPRVAVPSGLSRVIEKIVHNSLKFVASGDPPTVQISALESASGTLTVSIEDNGLGIELQYREAVFEPFKRLYPASQYPGSGLGLSICRRLLESIGGTIEVRGQTPPGTCVSITLPKV